MNNEIYITIPKNYYDQLLALKEGKTFKIVLYNKGLHSMEIMTTNEIVSLLSNKIKEANNSIQELINENHKLKKEISKKKILGFF